MRWTLVLCLFLAGCTSGRKNTDVPPEKEGIQGTINAKVGDVSDCYRTSLKKNPKLAGKLILEWEINPIGDPKNVKVIQSVDKAFDSCMVKKLSTWAFAPPPDNKIMTVRYPFVFAPAPPPPPPPPSFTSQASKKICPEIENSYAENCVRDEKTHECTLDEKQMVEVLKLIENSPKFEAGYLAELDAVLKNKKPSRSEANAILYKMAEDCWTPIHLRMWTSIFNTLKANPKHPLNDQAKQVMRGRLAGVSVPTPTLSGLSMDVKIIEGAAAIGLLNIKGRAKKDFDYLRSRVRSLVKAVGKEWKDGKVEVDDFGDALSAGVLLETYTRSPLDPEKVVPLARKELKKVKPIRKQLQDWLKKFWKKL